MKGTGVVMRGIWERLIILVAFGSRGAAVAVQQNLHFGYSYKNLPVTGFFGPITRGDVRDFQRKDHIGVDGLVGPITWNTIVSNEKLCLSVIRRDGPRRPAVNGPATTTRPFTARCRVRSAGSCSRPRLPWTSGRSWPPTGLPRSSPAGRC